MAFLIAVLNALFRLRHALSGSVRIGRGSLVYSWRLKMNGKGNCLSVGQDSIVQCRITFDGPNGHVSIGDRTYISASTSSVIRTHALSALRTATHLLMSPRAGRTFSWCVTTCLAAMFPCSIRLWHTTENALRNQWSGTTASHQWLVSSHMPFDRV